MKAQNKYGEFTLKDLEGWCEELFKKKPRHKKEVFYINEGAGFIPFEKSETFDRAMKAELKSKEDKL